MKVTRKMLLIIVSCLAVLLIAYGVLQHFFDLGISATTGKYITNGIIFAALMLYLYNRKLVKDEIAAKEAAEEAKRRKEEED